MTCTLIRDVVPWESLVATQDAVGCVYGARSEWDMSALQTCENTCTQVYETCSNTEPNPVCKIHVCGPPPYIARASYRGNMYAINNQVSYVCNDDTTGGRASSVCETSGTWTGPGLTCLLTTTEAPSTTATSEVPTTTTDVSTSTSDISTTNAPSKTTTTKVPTSTSDILTTNAPSTTTTSHVSTTPPAASTTVSGTATTPPPASTTVSGTATTTTPAPCAHEALYTPGTDGQDTFKYMISNSKIKHDAAKAKCSEYCGNLMEILTTDKLYFAKDAIGAHGGTNNDYWIDGENHVDGIWNTTSGGTIPIEGKFWSSYLPSLRVLTSERCVRLLPSDFEMNASECSNRFRYICEKDREPTGLPVLSDAPMRR